MNSQKFLSIVQNYNALNADEANELSSLQKRFPYSQIIHHLVARASQDLALMGKDVALRRSAVYATDRAVLKELMAALRVERREVVVENEVLQKITTHIDRRQSSAVEIEPVVVPSRPPLNNNFYEEIARDIAQLELSRHHFEAVVRELEEQKPAQLSPAYARPAPRVEVGEVDLIETIKSTKRQVAVEGEKQKAQTEIIDQFINAQPTINKLQPHADANDLTETVDLQLAPTVSETLVEILIKQGKNEKAIEMLKKLIWKFPQKKAYFAARIEELKK